MMSDSKAITLRMQRGRSNNVQQMEANVSNAHVGLKLGDARVCPTIMDHDFDYRKRVLETGRHPARGPFQTLVSTCKKCGREMVETRWFEETTAARSMGMLGDGAIEAVVRSVPPPFKAPTTTTGEEAE